MKTAGGWREGGREGGRDWKQVCDKPWLRLSREGGGDRQKIPSSHYFTVSRIKNSWQSKEERRVTQKSLARKGNCTRAMYTQYTGGIWKMGSGTVDRSEFDFKYTAEDKAGRKLMGGLRKEEEEKMGNFLGGHGRAQRGTQSKSITAT